MAAAVRRCSQSTGQRRRGDPHETTFNMADNRRDELALPGVFVVLPVYLTPLMRGDGAELIPRDADCGKSLSRALYR